MENKQSTERTLGFIEKKLDSILIFLFGDTKLDKDNVGFSARIRKEFEELKQEFDFIKCKIEEMEKKQIKYNVMTAVMWSCLGATAGLIIAYVITSISK